MRKTYAFNGKYFVGFVPSSGFYGQSFFCWLYQKWKRIHAEQLIINLYKLRGAFSLCFFAIKKVSSFFNRRVKGVYRREPLRIQFNKCFVNFVHSLGFFVVNLTFNRFQCPFDYFIIGVQQFIKTLISPPVPGEIGFQAALNICFIFFRNIFQFNRILFRETV